MNDRRAELRQAAARVETSLRAEFRRPGSDEIMAFLRGDDQSDPMYDQAVAIVLQNKRASISLVQRHLRIGYNRAARLLEQMEKSGVVSTMASNGNREIIAPRREAD